MLLWEFVDRLALAYRAAFAFHRVSIVLVGMFYVPVLGLKNENPLQDLGQASLLFGQLLFALFCHDKEGSVFLWYIVQPCRT